MNAKCPPVTLNVDEVVAAAKTAVLKECPSMMKNTKSVDGNVHKVAVSGLGKIGLIEPQIKADQFVLGFVTIPSVVNFATKLMQVGVVFPFQADMAVTRGAAAGATLLATLLSGGKSFLLGAFLGQFPSTLDAVADVAVTAIAKKSGKMDGAPVAMKGLGQTPEEELTKLRADLQKLSGMGTSTEYPEDRAEFPYVAAGIGGKAKLIF